MDRKIYVLVDANFKFMNVVFTNKKAIDTFLEPYYLSDNIDWRVGYRFKLKTEDCWYEFVTADGEKIE